MQIFLSFDLSAHPANVNSKYTLVPISDDYCNSIIIIYFETTQYEYARAVDPICSN